MGKRNRAALLPTNIPQLQNLIKRDPLSYKEEFLQQLRHFESSRTIFELKPEELSTDFQDLINFIAQVSPCYPEETKEFPDQIIALLSKHYQILNPELRRTMVQALVLLRNREMISSTSLLSLFFTLFRCRDKMLRDILYNHIVNDIKVSNQKAKNNKMNKTLQGFMYTMLTSAEGAAGTGSENAIAAKRSLDVCIELYRKNIWNDAKTVNVIAHACFSPVTKIMVTALQFFLGNNEADDDSDDEDELPDIKSMQHKQNVSKKTKSKAKQMDKMLATLKKKQKAKKKAETFNFSALHLLNDPQGFSEKLYSHLASSRERHEVQLMLMNLISRIIGVHKLTVLGFYPYLQKRLQPTQKDVTQIIAISAQASHDLVPPDVVEPVIRTLANNFVTEHCAAEVMAAGLNGIREIVSRCPLAMNATLLQDLTEYKNHRDKGVMMASRSLIGLFREINPELLKKKDRGRGATMNMRSLKPSAYGETHNDADFADLQLLAENADGDSNNGEGDDNDWDEWEEASEEENDDEEGGWINVSDDDNDLNIKLSDGEESEDENGNKKPKTKRLSANKERRLKKKGLLPNDDDDADMNVKEEDEQTKAKRLQMEAERKEKLAAAQLLATTKILTPADFAKIEALKMAKQADQKMNPTRANSGKRPAPSDETQQEGEVSIGSIIGPRKKAKQDYAERMESIKNGREGREKFGSRKGSNDRGSTTNKEKAKGKNFMMIAHKREVREKKKMSLRDKQIQLHAHIKKQKMMKK
ncbi:Protein SDA1 [Lobosporangium transversale]|uniref:Protein SDA1 n=1 Tax=Lobosporangium transversale TaxID=64571 RepID=A0A1Y2GZD4_9FUNG|nr:SDA1-domain-containing protein [Lobosporangium transversale]KAF9914811.1 Protein SDA1 [Lobosporangium transversale]ORZ27670.1 SDA1-domain-containing protein [Lobosporangium transversale]|eukprot:XP_021885373.1 SDA1-domain-containing protein [Lobosporangium transversale]